MFSLNFLHLLTLFAALCLLLKIEAAPSIGKNVFLRLFRENFSFRFSAAEKFDPEIFSEMSLNDERVFDEQIESDEDKFEKRREPTFLRFGREFPHASNSFLRFGRSNPAFLRFGRRSQSAYKINPHLHARKAEFLRFG